MELPTELQFRDVRKQQSVILSKESRQILPQNGTRFVQSDSGQTQIVFRFPNEEMSSTDFSTAWIVADLTVEGLSNTVYTQAQCNRWTDEGGKDVFVNATADLPFLSTCDGIESAIRSVQLLVNGSELERHDYYNYVESALNQHQNNAAFSNSIGAGAMLLNLHPYEKCAMLIGNATGARTSSNTIQVAFPLRWCGLANLSSLVCTSMIGSGQSAVELRIFLENASRFLVAGSFTVAANSGFASAFVKQTTPLTYVLDNVRLNYDVSITSPEYNSALRSYLSQNQLTLPIDTYYSTQFDIQSTQNGWLNFTVSTQFSDISAVYIAFFKADEQSSYAFCSTDRLVKPVNLAEARVQINGKPYPSTTVRLSGSQTSPEAECYQYLVKALRQNVSLEAIGMTNQQRESRKILKINTADASQPISYAANAASATYQQSEATSALLAAKNSGIKEILTASGLYYGVMRNTPPADGATINAATNTNMLYDEAYLFDSPSSFLLGFDVSKSSYGSEYEMLGQDLTKSSGLIQVNLRFNGAPGVNYSSVVIVKHKRLLDIGLDSSQVIY